jgi:cytochrome c peroxidase
MYFSDTLQKVDDTASRPRPATITLGSAPNWTPARRGEVWWNDATLCFQKWQSCASCHPDARMDGYNWDLLNDGMGNPKNTKSLLLAHKTPPSMWQGVRDNINNPDDPWDTEKQGLQCIRTGFKHILFIVPDEEMCKDIDAYLKALQPVASPFLVDGKLSAKAERGKKIFEDPKIGCTTCHPAPLFTDLKSHDTNTRCYYDQGVSNFDTPTLVEVWRTAPYLHDGRYVDMKDVFKTGRHGDVSGDIGKLSDVQIDELVEYVLSL